jgi:hypothetical protein
MKQMTKEDIIALWKSVGWTSAKEYHEYLLGQETLGEDFDSCLDPDNVDVKEFWRAAEEVFVTDPVANSNTNLGATLAEKEANFQNHLIPLFLGLYGGVEFAIFNAKRKFKEVHIAEIGCGYGSFEEHFINSRNVMYTGFDVIPRKKHFVEIEDWDGTFSSNQVKKYINVFNVFYSCNVFQHLSEKQITKYLAQINQLLPYGGFFVFSYTRKPELGYSYHYGQKIHIMEQEILNKKIQEAGFKIWYEYNSISQSNPNSLCPIGFVLEKI